MDMVALFYATVDGYCIGYEGVGAHGDVVNWKRGRWSGAVLISTAAGVYDSRQLQLGSAAGSSPGGLSSPTGCCRFVVNFFQDDIVAVECKSLNARELSGCWWAYFPTNDMISH